MTIGSSNTTGFARFFGTCIGAVCAIVSWIASRGNAVLLASFGWLMALWTAYIIVAQGKGPYVILLFHVSLFGLNFKSRDMSRNLPPRRRVSSLTMPPQIGNTDSEIII